METAISESVVRGYIQNGISELRSALPENLSRVVSWDIQQIRLIANELGLDSSNDQPGGVGDAEIHSGEREEIKPGEGSEDGKIIYRRKLRAGTGARLNRLLAEDANGLQAFLRRELEDLLRHVEIRKERALEVTPAPESLSQRWLEKHDVAIFFSRYARHSNDFRFLNAALKLNDRAFPFHKRFRLRDREVRYLLSLCEQERAVKELMK